MVHADTRPADRLPAEVTSLVGRQTETVEVKTLLTLSRLVTLTGPGGVGKTRLALHVARTVRAAFPDGVRMVPLAELSQADLLPATVLSRLGVSRPASAAGEDLVPQIGDRRLLLVLDNCEHLTEAVAELVGTLLAGCPRLHVLTTSRETLRVDGEALYRVPPLAVPGQGEAAGEKTAACYDSVALFLERARLVNAEVAEGRVDERAIAELCRRLDGLPLAIELAAAGTRWQSVESMLARPLPTSGPVSRSTPGRHQSLHASLDYSYALCSPTAQAMWARLSVFRGGATLSGVEAVCAGGRIGTGDVGSALAELIDKSVVVLDGSRYTMLETVRQYGAQRLAEEGEGSEIRQAHLRYVAELADGVLRNWFGPHQRQLLATVRADQANVRAALELAATDPATASTGLSIASALWVFWIGSGLPGEGRRWLSRLLAATDEPSPTRARALWTHGFLSAVDDDIRAARELLAECRRVAEDVGDAASAAHAECTLGVADLFDGRLDQAIEHLETGVAQERLVVGNWPYLADALINLGLAYCYRGDLRRAEAVLAEGAEICAARGEELLLSWALVFQALAALLDGRPRDAEQLACDSLRRKKELNNEQGMLWAIELLAWAAVVDGESERGAVLLAAGAARAYDFGPSFHGFPGMREWHERYTERAREALGPGAHHRASAHGGRLALEQMVSMALRELTFESGVTPTPLLDLPLTAREREIAELVATGMTNRQIADVLVIAPRTVDTHVQRILTKLDFTSRHQVVALVTRRERREG